MVMPVPGELGSKAGLISQLHDTCSAADIVNKGMGGISHGDQTQPRTHALHGRRLNNSWAIKALVNKQN